MDIFPVFQCILIFGSYSEFPLHWCTSFGPEDESVILFQIDAIEHSTWTSGHRLAPSPEPGERE